MGGQAFASGPEPLYTPRIPDHVYQEVKGRLHLALRAIFICVASPIEGPAKQDHGDIDILVAWDKQSLFPATNKSIFRRPIDKATCGNELDLTHQIESALGAHLSKITAATIQLAIPWPHDLLPTPDQATKGEDITDPEDTIIERYIQVDVQVCPSLEKFQWMLYRHAHGDFWSIMGSMIRPVGLTIDETALFIRIPEVEITSPKAARIELTRDVDEILLFLGLDIEGFGHGPFATTTDMFEYAATSRFFCVKPAKDANDATGSSDKDQTERSEGGDNQNGHSNDMKRVRTRPGYRAWVEDFIPACRAAGRFAPDDPNSTTETRRDAVRLLVFERWPDAEVRYHNKRKEYLTRRQRDEIWARSIKGNVPADLDTQLRSTTCNAFKKILLQGDESYGIRPPPEACEGGGPYGTWDVDAVSTFVKDKWSDVVDAVGPRIDSNHRKRLDSKRKAELSQLEVLTSSEELKKLRLD